MMLCLQIHFSKGFTSHKSPLHPHPGELPHISQLPYLVYARALLEYVIFILWVRSVSKMLPSVKFAEDKVLTFLILREKNAKIVQLRV